jgi:hypothetical protein
MNDMNIEIVIRRLIMKIGFIMSRSTSGYNLYIVVASVAQRRLS